MNLASVLSWPAFWGLLGSIVYAGPRLTACIYARESQGHVAKCFADAFTALVVSTISAAAFVPWVGVYLHATASEDIKAMSAVVGMLANGTTPAIIDFLRDVVLNRIRGGH